MTQPPLAGRDWEAFYQAGDTAWDNGRAHPALVGWLSENRLTGSILVPGSPERQAAPILFRVFLRPT